MKPRVRIKLKPSSSDQIKAYALLKAANESIVTDKKLDCLEYCPAGTVLEDVVRIAGRCTDLPPSLAYFSTLALVGARLTQEGFGCKFPDGKFVQPNVWVITLAPSGTGKTLLLEDVSQFVLHNALPQRLPDTITAAALHQYYCLDADDPDLSYRRARSAFIRDEVGELFRTLKRDSGEELRDQLLRTYGGSSLVRSTKKDGERATPPVMMSVYGSAVDASFFKVIDEDDYQNGLMQRFQFILAHDRPEHRISWYSFAGGVREAAQERFDAEWAEILQRPRELVVTPTAMRAFDAWFHERFKRGPGEESYFRRAAFVAFKYATVFSILSGSQNVDTGNLTLALRVIDRHLSDLHRCMSEYTAVNQWHAILLKVRARLASSPNTVSRAEVLRSAAKGISSHQLNIVLQTLADEGDEIGATASRLIGQARAVHPYSPRYSPPKKTGQSLAA